MAERIEDFIARAIEDPGSVLEQDYPMEPTHRHATRAVMSLLAVMLGPDPEGFYPHTPATKALMDNADLRTRVATLEQDAAMWRRRAKDAEGGQRLGHTASERIDLLEHLLALSMRHGGLPSWLTDRIVEHVPDVEKLEV